MPVRIERIYAKELEQVLERSGDEAWTEIFLIGPDAYTTHVKKAERHFLRQDVPVFQLIEFVPELVKKLSVLTDLQTLHIPGHRIKFDELKWLSNLQNLQTLDIADNHLGIQGGLHLKNLPELRNLDISHNNIGEAGAQFVGALTGLNVLKIAGNHIGAKGLSLLSRLEQLNVLDVGHNHIGTDGACYLGDFRALSSLSVADNKLGTDGLMFLRMLQPLEFLDVRHNYIDSTGLIYLSFIESLIALNISGNIIEAAGLSNISELENLRILELYNNPIGQQGGKYISKLSKLNTLNVAGCELGDEGIFHLGQLKDLMTLDITDNQVGYQGCKSLKDLEKLSVLDIKRNPIGVKGAEYISRISSLEELNLAGNCIQDDGLMHLTKLQNLKKLNLSGNNIGGLGSGVELQYIGELTQLEVLKLSSNYISSGLSYLMPLTRLRSLDLSSNRIGNAHARFIENLEKLQILDIKANQIGDEALIYICRLNDLRELDISQNQVQDEGAKLIGKMARLRNLNIRKNGVTNLEPLMSLYEQRTKIDAAYCPITTPPAEIVEQGNDSILNYFRERREQGVDHLFEAKVLLLGDGGVGKTSLYRRLYVTSQAELPKEKETTRGIDIHRHSFLMPGHSRREFGLNIWDFAGQEIYYATHQFFLTKRSLYILVDDARNNDQTIYDRSFRYWLEAVETIAGDCPVLVYQNEKSGRKKQIDKKLIQSRFSNVKKFFAGDLINLDAANGIREEIKKEVMRLEHIGEELPAKWIVIRERIEIEAQDKAYISQEDYFQIYAEVIEENPERALYLSRYLHDLGVFLHFAEDPRLKDTVFLKNEWVTGAVFRMLEDPEVNEAWGRFDMIDCARVWCADKYENKHEELIALMEKFELCYPLQDEWGSVEAWLIPQLLSAVEPKEITEWKLPGDLQLVYKYEFMPKGIINRLMVRQNHYVKDLSKAWKNGVFFQKDNHTILLVTLGKSREEIVLRARGRAAEDLRAEIAGDLDKINKGFSGLKGKVEKKVPCCCEQCISSLEPEFYEYDMLRRRERNYRWTIECLKSYEYVSVRKLLRGLMAEESKPDEIEVIDLLKGLGMTVDVDLEPNSLSVPKYKSLSLPSNDNVATASQEKSVKQANDKSTTNWSPYASLKVAALVVIIVSFFIWFFNIPTAVAAILYSAIITGVLSSLGPIVNRKTR